MSFDVCVVPPSSPKLYTIPNFAGEKICIPTSNSVMRLLVTGAASNGAFGVLTTEGKASDPIGFHYHNEAHDVFLCLKGRVAVWAETRDGDKVQQARVLEPGDFASVPPGTVHQYQFLSPYTRFLGLIVPGGWEEFFRTIGDPYDGVLFPTNDERPFHTALLPRLKKAAEEHDMVPQPQHRTWEPSPWSDTLREGEDENRTKTESLPDALRPYFLRASSGPKWRVGGIVIRRMCGINESDKRFTMAEISGLGGRMELPLLKFETAHHCFYIAEGSLSIKMMVEGSDQSHERQEHIFTAGDTAFVPAGQAFGIEWKSPWGRAYVFCSERGVPGLLEDVGEQWHEPIAEEMGVPVDKSKIEVFARKGRFSVI